MAEFLKFWIVFGIGLSHYYGSLSVHAQQRINKVGPEPPLKFKREPPAYVLTQKGVPTILNCLVYVTDDAISRADFQHFEEHDFKNNNPILNPNASEIDDRHRISGPLLDNSRFYNMNRRIPHDDDDYEDNDEDEDDDESDGGRFTRSINDEIEYSWTRDNEPLISSFQKNVNGFRLFNNGSLKIASNFNSTGVYRCKAMETRRGIGAIISRHVHVENAFLMRENSTNPKNVIITGFIGHPVLLVCPISSVPMANFTWYFNRSIINSRTVDNRYILLKNGSLLIVDAKDSDSGKYKCNASNFYTSKPTRAFALTLNIGPAPVNSETESLWTPFQEESISVKEGTTLTLYCAGSAKKINWTFTPRFSKVPIELSNFNNELKYVNVSLEKHDGIYNCSTKNDYQLFNVTVSTPPRFLNEIKSVTSSAIGFVTLNVSVAGNPKPDLVWYKNGEIVDITLNRYFEYPIFRISSIEPEDEGIYQFFAKNDFGETSATFYLTIRNKFQQKQIPSPKNVKCFPIDQTSLLVTFDMQEKYVFETVNYNLASLDPYVWTSEFIKNENGTIKISKNLVPFKTYTLFLRGMVSMGGESLGNSMTVLMSRLSQGVKCATQGLTMYSINSPTGIFVWWKPPNNVNISAYIIQFYHENPTHQVVFSNEIVGTYKEMDDLYVTWSEVEQNLVKFPVTTGMRNVDYSRKRRSVNASTDGSQNTPNSSEKMENGMRKLVGKESTGASKNASITEVKVSGNVTGILIPNSAKVVVRTLAVLNENGTELEQDFRYLSWKTINWSAKNMDALIKFDVFEENSRSVAFQWTSTEPENNKKCYELCYKKEDIIAPRGNSFDCEIIHLKDGSYVVKQLQPFSRYVAFLKECETQSHASKLITAQTKPDVPSPVTEQMIRQTDGLTLIWSPPKNPNGAILYYQIEWNLANESHCENVTHVDGLEQFKFKFPNATKDDKFNITVRAVGTSGVGYPLYLNLSKIRPMIQSESRPFEDNPLLFWLLAFAIGALILVILLVGLLCIRRKSCSKNLSDQGRDQSASNTPQAAPKNCTTDIHEMQTLISRPEIPIIPNGKENSPPTVESENGQESRVINGFHTTDFERQRMLIVTSTPNKVAPPIDANHDDPVIDIPEIPQITTEPIVPASAVLHVNNGTSPKHMKPRNGFLKTFQHPPNTTISTSPSNVQPVKPLTTFLHQSSPPKYSPKLVRANGNLRITENPQYLPKAPSMTMDSSSIFDNSQQKLINSSLDSCPELIQSTELTNFNNNNNTNNNNNNNERLKVGKADSIETDDCDDEEIDELHATFDLNESNLSSKPLHANNWQFRQPIVGPNG